MRKIRMNEQEMREFVVLKNFKNDPYNEFIRFEEEDGKTYVVYFAFDPGTEDRVEICEFINSQLPEDQIVEKRLILELINPWSGEEVEMDVTDLTYEELESFASLMDDDLREELHREMAPCSPGEFLYAWAQRVSTKEASRVILGS